MPAQSAQVKCFQLQNLCHNLSHTVEYPIRYAFDQVADHFDIIVFNIKQFPLNNVDVMPFGFSDINIYCDLIVINTYAPGFTANNHRVPLLRIDDLVADGTMERMKQF